MNIKRKFRKLWVCLRDLLPAYCNDCKKKMKYTERINMASCSVIGVFYKGDGICVDCVDKHMYEALNKPDCKQCNDTGLYNDQHDGGSVEVTCHCPAGEKAYSDWLKKNPEFK